MTGLSCRSSHVCRDAIHPAETATAKVDDL